MRQTDWDKHAIKAAVHRRGKTLQQVAVDAGLHASACWVALNRRWAAGENAIAAFLGLPVHVLWPDRYPSRLSRRAVNDARSGGASPKLAVN